MPAMKEPTEPKAETQSLQLICSLTPSSTEPSTWLVIIWLKRWFARPLMELPLLPPSVGVGVGDGDGLGDGEPLYEQFSKHSCAVAECVCAVTIRNESTSVSTADRSRPCAILFIVSARTASNWDHRACRHRRSRSRCRGRPPKRRSR